MGQFVTALKGIGEAVSALDMPIVSGNVSLYNETDGAAILPTPTIGAVGLIAENESPIIGKARVGHVLLLLGENGEHLGQSALLHSACGRTDGDAPVVDLDAEKINGEFIRSNRALIEACTDISAGGLALAAFEMAAAADVVVQLDTSDIAALFGEDQARYLLVCDFDQAEALMSAASHAQVTLQFVGKFGGSAIKFGSLSSELAELCGIYRNAFAEQFS